MRRATKIIHIRRPAVKSDDVAEWMAGHLARRSAWEKRVANVEMSKGVYCMLRLLGDGLAEIATELRRSR